jgi:hypothetical protein
MIIIRMLPDKSGRRRIHWFQRQVDGPLATQGQQQLTLIGPMQLGGAKGRIVCQGPNATLDKSTAGNVEPVAHSDDPRAVTCPECKATQEFQTEIALYKIGG